MKRGKVGEVKENKGRGSKASEGKLKHCRGSRVC